MRPMGDDIQFPKKRKIKSEPNEVVAVG